jgi:hypothetical protein
VVTLDDATSSIYSAILVEEEGTQSSFLGVHETIAAQGLFVAFYTDHDSHYLHTPKTGCQGSPDFPQGSESGLTARMIEDGGEVIRVPSNTLPGTRCPV